jgi:hypothetical protein
MNTYGLEYYDEYDIEAETDENQCSAYEYFEQTGICFPGWYFYDPNASWMAGPYATIKDALTDAKTKYTEADNDHEQISSTSCIAGWYGNTRSH